MVNNNLVLNKTRWVICCAGFARFLPWDCLPPLKLCGKMILSSASLWCDVTPGRKVSSLQNNCNHLKIYTETLCHGKSLLRDCFKQRDKGDESQKIFKSFASVDAVALFPFQPWRWQRYNVSLVYSFQHSAKNQRLTLSSCREQILLIHHSQRCRI